MPRGGRPAAAASGPRRSSGGEGAGRCLPQDARGARRGSVGRPEPACLRLTPFTVPAQCWGTGERAEETGAAVNGRAGRGGRGRAGADAARSPRVLQIFEWWYFRKYGTSFIEQVSVSHLRPLLGGVDNSAPSTASAANGDADSSRQSVSGEGRRAAGRAHPLRRRELPPLPRLSRRCKAETLLLRVPVPWVTQRGGRGPLCARGGTQGAVTAGGRPGGWWAVELGAGRCCWVVAVPQLPGTAAVGSQPPPAQKHPIFTSPKGATLDFCPGPSWWRKLGVPWAACRRPTVQISSHAELWDQTRLPLNLFCCQIKGRAASLIALANYIFPNSCSASCLGCIANAAVAPLFWKPC